MGKILLVLLVLSQGVKAAESGCEGALAACQVLVQTEDTQVTHLKQSVKALEKEVQDEEPSILSWWGWMLVGGIAGGVVVEVLHK